VTEHERAGGAGVDGERSRMAEAFSQSWGREFGMTEQERCIVRACLDEVSIGLTEAIEVRAWLEKLGPELRRQVVELNYLVTRLRRDLD
jgi:ribonuclease I